MAVSQVTSDAQVNRQKNLILALICLALAILTIVVFLPIRDSGFVSLDDDVYVYENTSIQSGLNWDSIKQAFSFELAKRSGHWHPVTWLSWMVDYTIFGLNPFGYHLVNLLFHVLNTILLFLILHRMTKALWPSAFVAALFAIHPLHVESVAWVTERKDVLSTFFWMLTVGAYSYYVENRELKRYVFVLIFFVLGLMSKSMLVTLPFVLLLLDYWPLRRFSEVNPGPAVQTAILKPAVSGRQKKKSRKKDTEKGMAKEVPKVGKPAVSESQFKWSLIYPLLLEKVPLFILSIFSSIAAVLAAHSAGAVHTEDIPLGDRIGNAFVSYIAYIGKMILPINLAVLYPYPKAMILWQVLGAVMLLIVITFAVIRLFRKVPYLSTGWLWYLGTLVPVIGIVQAGPQAMADRYTYISMIGLFVIVAWGIPDLLNKWQYRKETLLALSILSVLFLATMTWRQVGYWQNSITLYNHTLEITDGNWLISFNRGNILHNHNNFSQAIEDYNKAIASKSDCAELFNNRGAAYKDIGDYKKALEDLNKSILIKPKYAAAYNNRGGVYHKQGNFKQALDDYDRAIEINPGFAEFYKNRGVVYNHIGNFEQAIMDFNKAIEINPGYAEVYFNRGNAWFGLGIRSQAIEDYGRAIKKQPNYMDAYFNRGITYAKDEKKDLATKDIIMAAQLGDERAINLLKQNRIKWQ